MKRHFKKALFLCVLLFVSVLSSHATLYTWTRNAGTNNWTDSGNWSYTGSPGGYPGSGGSTTDDVVINYPTLAANTTIVFPTGVLTLNSISASGSPYYYRLALNMNGCALTVSGTKAILNYADLTSATSIAITASDQTSIINCTFADFAITISSTSTTRADTQGNQALYISNSTFGVVIDGVIFTAEAKTLGINNSTFKTQTTITKKNFNSSTTPAQSNLSGYNTFNGTTTLICVDNTSSSSISWATAGDVFNGVTTIQNNSSNGVVICPFGGTIIFNNDVYFYNTSSATINISNGPSCTVNFNGTPLKTNKVFYYNSGAGTIVIGNSGAIGFSYANVVVGNTSATTGAVRISSSGATNAGVVSLDAHSTFSVYPDASTAPAGYPYFSTGSLYIDNMNVATGVPAINLTLGVNTTSVTLKSRCVFNCDLNAQACSYVSLGGTYNGNTSFTNLACSIGETTLSEDQLTFNRNVSFINQSASVWNVIGTTASITKMVYFKSTVGFPRSVVTVQAQGAGGIVFGYYYCTMNFNSVDLKLMRIPTSIDSIPGSIQVGNLGKTEVDVNSVVYIQETVALGTTSGVMLGNTSSSSVYQPFDLYGTIDASGFTNGNLVLGHLVTYNPVSIINPVGSANSTTIMVYAPVVFGSTIYMQCQNFGSYGGIHNGDATYHLHGAGFGSYVFTGAPVFNGNCTLINESTNGNTLFMGNNTNDVFTFNGNVVIQNNMVSGATAVPQIKLSRNGISYIKGNLSYSGEFGTLPFGVGVLRNLVFNGTTDQSVTLSNSTTPILLTNLEVNKASGKLILGANTNVTISKYGSIGPLLTLTQGNIVTSATSLLTLADAGVIGTSGVGVGGPTSFIEGPLKKVGNIPSGSTFTFPIGKSTIATPSVLLYMPLTISMPSSTTKAFTAEFFNQSLPTTTTSRTLDPSIEDVQMCQYWTLNSTGTSIPVTVGLVWNNNVGQSCYPVNNNVVSIAYYNASSSKWVNVPSSTSGSYTSGTVTSNSTVSSFGFFSLGYTNALVINTIATNAAPFTITSGCEPLNPPFVTPFTSGVSGSSAGEYTILGHNNDVPGKIVVHPNYNSTLGISILNNAGNTNEVLNINVITSPTGNSNVVSQVQTNEGAGFANMSTNYYNTSGTNLTFYKQRQESPTWSMANNLPDGITFYLNTTTSNPNVPFQISNVPSGSTATLTIYKSDGTTIAIQNSTLSWDGTLSGATAGEGLYPYTLALTVGSQNYTYTGQLIVKHQ